MDNEQRQEIAQICRRQALLASTPETRAALTELAEEYELGGLVVDLPERPSEKLE